MIILVNGNEQADYAYLTNKTFRIRAKVMALRKTAFIKKIRSI